jgi:high-affinity iron transporter
VLAVAVIVFREVLEAALIVGIVMAASYGIPHRERWIGAGIGAGIVGSIILALVAGQITNAFSGMGQELLNATILLLAVGMLAWHNIWMAQHGREMAIHARQVGEAIRTGARPLTALALIAASASLREGAETVLFITGIATSGQETILSMALGGLGGLGAGVAAGVTIYLGLLRVPLSRLFTVTAWMVLLLAAGLAAQAVGFLVQADLMPPLGDQMWDSSFLLSEGSLVGRVLHTLLGYNARPMGVQLLAYLGTMLAIGVPMYWLARPRPSRLPVVAAGLVLAASLTGSLSI